MSQSHTSFWGLPVGGEGEWGGDGKQIRRENGEGGPSKMKTSQDKTSERPFGTKARVRLKCLESKR